MRDSIRGPLCLIGAMTVALSLSPARAQERLSDAVHGRRKR